MGQKTSGGGNQNFTLININPLRNQMSSGEHMTILRALALISGIAQVTVLASTEISWKE